MECKNEQQIFLEAEGQKSVKTKYVSNRKNAALGGSCTVICIMLIQLSLHYALGGTKEYILPR